MRMIQKPISSTIVYGGSTVVGDTPYDIKIKYESNPNTNAYTDAEKAKLARAVVYNRVDNGNIIIANLNKFLGVVRNGEQRELLGIGRYITNVPLSEVELGYDLRGTTITFDTTKAPVKVSEGNEGIIIVQGDTWAMHVEVYESAILMYCNGVVVYNDEQGGWLMDSYTFPNQDFTIVYYPPLTHIDTTTGFNPQTDVQVGVIKEQTEVGSESVHLNTNSPDRPTNDGFNGKQEYAFISDIPTKVGVGESGTGENSEIFNTADNIANGNYSHAEGYNTITNNVAEHASGQYNQSIASDDAAQATTFSIGNGSSTTRSNAFEIKQNGDIYIIKDGASVKLQDLL